MGKTESGGSNQREEAPQGKKPRAGRQRRGSDSQLVEQAIQKIKSDLESNQVKSSVTDLIRLLQLRKELNEEQPREIKVSWVEPREEEHAGEE